FGTRMLVAAESPGKGENHNQDQSHDGRHCRARDSPASPGEEKDADRSADDACLQPLLPEVPGRGQRNAVVQPSEQADAAGFFDRFEFARARSNVRQTWMIESPFAVEYFNGLGVILASADGGKPRRL